MFFKLNIINAMGKQMHIRKYILEHEIEIEINLFT